MDRIYSTAADYPVTGTRAVMWSTRIAGSIASGAGISSGTTRAASAAITYSSMGKSGLARLGRIAPKGGRKRKTGDGI